MGNHPLGPEHLDFMQSRRPTLLELKTICSHTKARIREGARGPAVKGELTGEEQCQCNQSLSTPAGDRAFVQQNEGSTLGHLVCWWEGEAHSPWRLGGLGFKVLLYRVYGFQCPVVL